MMCFICFWLDDHGSDVPMYAMGDGTFVCGLCITAALEKVEAE